MSDLFTDADVTAGRDALLAGWPTRQDGSPFPADVASATTYSRAVLAATLPAIRLRWEQDIEAGGLPLIEHDQTLILHLADVHDELIKGLTLSPHQTGEWLRATAADLGDDA